MKALVLTCDRYRPITEHMLKTYEQHWPENPLTFVIPFQTKRTINRHGQRVEMLSAPREIAGTVQSLLAQVRDDEWFYWCIDDKFLLSIDAESASYFAAYVQRLGDPRFAGLSFCRARHLWAEPTVSSEVFAKTERGDELLRRYNYNNIWLPQFLRKRALKNLFAQFPNHDYRAIEMDSFTSQGPNALPVAEDLFIYVTRQNFVAFGESTVGGRITKGCLESMTRMGLEHPLGFEAADIVITIGSHADWKGE